MIFKRAVGLLIGITIVSSIILTCGGKATDSRTGFAVYGRIVWRPPLTGLSLAEFHVFNNGQGVENADIVVGNDTIFAVTNESGLYRGDIQIDVGDTVAYSVSATYGSAQGTVIIPDTVSIIEPARYDTLGINSAFTAVWHSSPLSDGYYAFLNKRPYDVGGVAETPLDTTLDIPGTDLINIGIDTLWVEVLRGVFVAEQAPDGRMLPRGVVGAAGNYCEIYFRLE